MRTDPGRESCQQPTDGPRGVPGLTGLLLRDPVAQDQARRQHPPRRTGRPGHGQAVVIGLAGCFGPAEDARCFVLGGGDERAVLGPPGGWPDSKKKTIKISRK